MKSKGKNRVIDLGEQLSNSEQQCRICFDNERDQENSLICPCICSGSIKYVHQNCMKAWIRSSLQKMEVQEEVQCLESSSIPCEVCKSQITFDHEEKLHCKSREDIRICLSDTPTKVGFFCFFLLLSFSLALMAVAHLGKYWMKGTIPLGVRIMYFSVIGCFGIVMFMIVLFGIRAIIESQVHIGQVHQSQKKPQKCDKKTLQNNFVSDQSSGQFIQSFLADE